MADIVLNYHLDRIGTTHCPARNFVERLPTIPHHLYPPPETNDKCSICQVEYGSKESGNETPEEKIQLPCGHHCGRNCMLVWVDPGFEGGHGTNCPICRAELPSEDSGLLKASGMQIIDDDRSRDYRRWLVWIIQRHGTARGAALDREYQAGKAIMEARRCISELNNTAWQEPCDAAREYIANLVSLANHDYLPISAIQTTQQEQRKLVHRLIHQDSSFTTASNGGIVLTTSGLPVRMPYYGQRALINLVFAKFHESPKRFSQHQKSFECQQRIPEGSPIDSTEWPDWVQELWERDFGGMDEGAIWQALRSRRMIMQIHNELVGQNLRNWAGREASARDLDDYAQDPTFVDIDYLPTSPCWHLDTAGEVLYYDLP